MNEYGFHEEMIPEILSVYKDRKVLITGHTGFKGSWLCLLLHRLGALVYGYALEPPTTPSLYKEARIDELVTSFIGDIRDLNLLQEVISKVQPEIVIHMAAQPLVRDSYKLPVETYSINVMGTVHVMEACRNTPGIKAIVNVTTDKCYENKEWYWGYRENEILGGYDPYSNSKSCSELVTLCYRNSFFNPADYQLHGIAIASARAGNVIGGGDWASDRLIPDIISALLEGKKPEIRMPYAVRPWQHVFDCLTGYLTLAAHLYNFGARYNGAWNFGPDEKDAEDVEWLTRAICNEWGNGILYSIDERSKPHETDYLRLDCSKARSELKWNPKWNIGKSVKAIVEWYVLRNNGGDVRTISLNQLDQYFDHKVGG